MSANLAQYIVRRRKGGKEVENLSSNKNSLQLLDASSEEVKSTAEPKQETKSVTPQVSKAEPTAEKSSDPKKNEQKIDVKSENIAKKEEPIQNQELKPKEPSAKPKEVTEVKPKDVAEVKPKDVAEVKPKEVTQVKQKEEIKKVDPPKTEVSKTEPKAAPQEPILTSTKQNSEQLAQKSKFIPMDPKFFLDDGFMFGSMPKPDSLKIQNCTKGPEFARYFKWLTNGREDDLHKAFDVLFGGDSRLP